MSEDVIDVLYVEDNRGDLMLMEEALEELQRPIRLHHVSDGEQACDFLARSGEYASAPAVTAMILDLNLPRKSGLEVLRDLAQAPELAPRIVVLTTAAREDTVREAAAPLSVLMLTKPLGFDEFVPLINKIERYARGE